MRDMRLTDQAVGAIMMALQKSLIEQSDIVPTLKNFVFDIDGRMPGEKFEPLIVINPPVFSVENSETEEE